MRAIVVGGGIGGQAAGVALARVGWDVTVLERAEGGPEIGAGISLWPNALRALDHLDVWPDVRTAASMQIGGVRRPDGRSLSRMDAAAAPFDVLLVHRQRLHEELAKALPCGALVRGASVTSVTPGADVDYVRAGETVTDHADLVVAADGLRSGIRQELWPEHPGARYAGFTAWRGVTAEPFPLEAASETWGRGSEFGATILVDGRVYWFATANVPEGERSTDEHDEVLRRFGAWHAPLAAIVEATPADAVLRHDIYYLPPPLPPFARGRVALLGDAAHAMTPNLGQGACQAIEDAVTLAALVDSGDVPAALARYDVLRRPRAEKFAKNSLRAARVLQTESSIGMTLRNTAARVVPARLAARPVRRMIDWLPPR